MSMQQIASAMLVKVLYITCDMCPIIIFQIWHIASTGGSTIREDTVQLDDETKSRLRERVKETGRKIDTTSLAFQGLTNIIYVHVHHSYYIFMSDVASHTG